MRLLLISLALLPLACGKEEAPVQKAPPAPPVDMKLAADPGEALSVLEAKEKGSGEEVVVVGRISNIVSGRVIFNLVDDSLAYCGRGGEADSCKTPWDYCCVNAGQRAKATLAVEARGPDGNVLAASVPTLRLLDLLAVKGKVEKDEHGNVTIVATGWFPRERPDLAKDLHWPE